METVKGFKDKTGKEAEKAAFIRKIAEQTFEKYNFQEIETPIIEYEKFVKSNSDENDDAISEVFKLKDKGKRNLALRYEFTFQLKRIANKQKLPFKRFQIGPVFRDEPVKGNRLRQFTQCDIDTIGTKIKDQAELLAAFNDILTALKVNSTIYVNNRKIIESVAKLVCDINDENLIKQLIRYLDKLDKKTPSEIIEEMEIQNDTFSNLVNNIKNMKKLNSVFLPLLNTLRNNTLDELKQYYIGILRNRGREKDYENSLFKEGYEELKELEKYCKYYGINLKFQGYLARGLSYYTGNVFEIKSSDIKETICGGGTYMVGNTEASGISFSIERLMTVSNIIININKTLVVSLKQDKKSIEIAKQLRKQGENASVFFGKPSKALDYANSYGINKVIFVGQQEVETKKFKVKDMQTGKEVIITIEKKKKIRL